MVDGLPSPTAQAAQAKEIKQEIESMSVEALHQALTDWESVFAAERQEGGFLHGIVGRIQPLTILHELHRARSSESQAQNELAALHHRLLTAGADSAHYQHTNVLLRQEIIQARTASDTSIIQLRQFLLDPAVNREFSRMATAATAANLKAAHYENEMKKMHEVANHPAGPRMMEIENRKLREELETLQRGRGEGVGGEIGRAHV